MLLKKMITWSISIRLNANVHVRRLIFFFSLKPGSQERQDKLKEIGFVDILHKLTQAADPNLSERWVTISNKFQF